MTNNNEKTLKNLAIALVTIGIFFVGISGSRVEAATLYLVPKSSNVLVGGTFDLSLVLDTKDAPINVVESELFFPPDKLQLASPSFGESIIQIWPTPPVFSNKEGRVYLVGGIPAPGLNTPEGIVLTLTFRVVSTGGGEIRFGNKTSVLAHDGAGTDVLTEKSSAYFRSSLPPSFGPIISSPTHPDQEKWYSNNSPVFLWTKSPASEGFSFEIDNNPKGFPDTVTDATATTTSFANIKNGIWYFHLKEKAEGVWGGTSHYAVKIDDEPPEPFMINVSPSTRTVSQSPVFRFGTSDALSGLDHLEMKIVPLSSGVEEQLTFFETTSPYQAINWKLGRYLVLVRAKDYAGNTRDESVTVSSANLFSRFFDQEGVDLIIAFIPWIWIILGTILVIFVVLFVFTNLWMRQRLHLRTAFREDTRRLSRFILRKK